MAKCFSDSRHYAFDECGRLNIKEGHKIYDELLTGKSILDLDTDIEAFTHVLAKEQKIDRVKVYLNTLICEKISPNMILCYDTKKLYVYKKGSSNYQDNQEFLSYHFVNDKNKITFSYPKWKIVPDKFYITQYGFFKEEQLKYLIILKPIRYIKGLLSQSLKRLKNKNSE